MKKVIIAITAIGFLTACGGGNSSKKVEELEKLRKQQSELNEKIKSLEAEIALTDTSRKDKIKFVAATDMSLKPFTHYIEVQANVEGDEDVVLSAKTPGTVTSVNVKAGDHVTKGQVLATLDDQIMQKAIAEVQNELNLVTTLYNRQKNLWDQQIGSEVQYLEAKTRKEGAEKKLASIQEQWDMTRIKAPFSGTVDNVMIKTGQLVSPQVPAIRVVNLEMLKVKGELPETYIGRVNKNDNALVYFPDLGKETNALSFFFTYIGRVNKNDNALVYFPDLGKEITSKVYYSGNAISNLNRTFNVEVRFGSKENFLRPNMLAVLKIADYNKEKAMSLPVSVVQKGLDGEYVFVAENSGGKTVAKRKTVKSGMTYNGNVEIVEGLNEGDKVITTGYHDLVEGDIIKL